MSQNEEKKLDTRKNPKEFAYKVTTQTLAFENHFSRATFENDCYPLEIYDGFSRLTGVIINEDKKAATFNIPKRDLPALIKKSEFAFNKEMEEAITSIGESDTQSIAYTVRFTSGKLKGKSPAEVLLESSDNKELLNNQWKFLKSNLEKYPKNKLQMDAIEEASRLLNDGSLSSSSVKKEVIIPIYNPGFRPLRSRPQKDGKTFVYDVKINWHVGSENPLTIEVSNFYAPVVQTDIGLLNVKVKEKDSASEIKNTMSLSPEMWEDIIYNIQMQMRAFEICGFSNALKMAEEQDKINRKNASQNSQS